MSASHTKGEYMSLSDLAALGSFVSGIAVVVSFVFLAIQLRQNTQAVRASASQAHAAELSQIMEPLIAHSDIAHAWRAGLADPRALNDDDRMRFLAICSGIFRFYDTQRLQWRHGQLDAEHWHSVQTQIGDIVRLPGIQIFWQMRRHWHSAEFRSWVDALPKDGAEHGFYDLPAADTPAPRTP